MVKIKLADYTGKWKIGGTIIMRKYTIDLMK